MEIPLAFQRYRTAFDGELQAAVPVDGLPLYDMARYHLGWVDEVGRPTPGGTGKALRPALCLFSCDALGGRWEPALPAAVAVELVHSFSLVHDDIQDHDIERRHRPTVWYLWGRRQGITTGVTLWSLANRSLQRCLERGATPAQILHADRALTEAARDMIEGQCLDITLEGRLDVNLAGYIDMVTRKTGALIGCALELGAIFGSRDPALASRFQRVGRYLGIVFQVRDDILGIWGSTESTGKPVGADILRKKKSLPVVFTLRQATGAARDLLQTIYQKTSIEETDVNRVLEIMDRVHARSYAQGLAEEKCAMALAELSQLELSREARQAVDELVSFLLLRDR